VFSGATCVDTRIRSLKPELESRSIITGNLLQSRAKGRVSADCVRGDWRSSSLYCSTSVKSVVVVIVSCHVRVKAAEVQCRLEAVKNFIS